MTKKYFNFLWLICLVFVLGSCTDDNAYSIVEPDPVSPVIFDLASVPYQTLSEYNFFEDNLAELNPVYGVLPYTLSSTLFTDYGKS